MHPTRMAAIQIPRDESFILGYEIGFHRDKLASKHAWDGMEFERH